MVKDQVLPLLPTLGLQQVQQGSLQVGVMVIGALATLACTSRAAACVASRTCANGAVMGGGGKEYGGGGTPNEMGVIGGGGGKFNCGGYWIGFIL